MQTDARVVSVLQFDVVVRYGPSRHHHHHQGDYGRGRDHSQSRSGSPGQPEIMKIIYQRSYVNLFNGFWKFVSQLIDNFQTIISKKNFAYLSCLKKYISKLFLFRLFYYVCF